MTITYGRLLNSLKLADALSTVTVKSELPVVEASQPLPSDLTTWQTVLSADVRRAGTRPFEKVAVGPAIWNNQRRQCSTIVMRL